MPTPDSPSEMRSLDLQQEEKADAADRDALKDAFAAFDELFDLFDSEPKSARAAPLACFDDSQRREPAIKLVARIPWVRVSPSMFGPWVHFCIDWRAHDAARDDLDELDGTNADMDAEARGEAKRDEETT